MGLQDTLSRNDTEDEFFQWTQNSLSNAYKTLSDGLIKILNEADEDILDNYITFNSSYYFKEADIHYDNLSFVNVYELLLDNLWDISLTPDLSYFNASNKRIQEYEYNLRNTILSAVIRTPKYRTDFQEQTTKQANELTTVAYALLSVLVIGIIGMIASAYMANKEIVEQAELLLNIPDSYSQYLYTVASDFVTGAQRMRCDLEGSTEDEGDTDVRIDYKRKLMRDLEESERVGRKGKSFSESPIFPMSFLWRLFVSLIVIVIYFSMSFGYNVSLTNTLIKVIVILVETDAILPAFTLAENYEMALFMDPAGYGPNSAFYNSTLGYIDSAAEKYNILLSVFPFISNCWNRAQ